MINARQGAFCRTTTRTHLGSIVIANHTLCNKSNPFHGQKVEIISFDTFSVKIGSIETCPEAFQITFLNLSENRNISFLLGIHASF